MKRFGLIVLLPLVGGCQLLGLAAKNGGRDLQKEPVYTRKKTYDKLPDTSRGRAVYAFSDQPAQSNPLDKTVRFAATHFAGTQKMTAEQKARFAEINPDWVQLHYRLGVASGPANYLHGNRWDSDWSVVTRQNDWFLRDSSGARSQAGASDGSWNLHDLSNVGFQTYWLDNVANDLQATDSDGVFADSFMAGVGCALLVRCDARLQNTGAADVTRWPRGETWLSLLNDWAELIESHLHALPGEPLLLPNLDALNTFWAVSQLRLGNLDGGFLEGFPILNRNADYSGANTNALTLTANDRFVIMQSTIDPADVNQRSFVIGTYLLLKGKRTFLNLIAGTSDTGFYYWPEYQIELGAPTAPLPRDFTGLRWGNLYRRDFEKGIVLVNGGSNGTVASLPAGTTFYKVTATGGGAINELDIDANGEVDNQSLGYTAIAGTLSVPAWSAVILLSARP